LFDDECNEACALTSGCSADPDCSAKSGFNIWGLILILLGLMVIGGFSYYLYYVYQQRLEQQRQQAAMQARQQAAMQQQPSSRISPEERAKMMATLKKKREQELKNFKEHAAAKTEERHKAVGAFGGEKKNEQKETSGTKGASRASTTESPEAEPGKFIPLKDIGKVKHKLKSKAIGKKIDELKKKSGVKTKEDDSAFDKLDDLIDEDEK
jgi:hypothetical protein